MLYTSFKIVFCHYSFKSLHKEYFKLLFSHNPKIKRNCIIQQPFLSRVSFKNGKYIELNIHVKSFESVSCHENIKERCSKPI